MNLARVTVIFLVGQSPDCSYVFGGKSPQIQPSHNLCHWRLVCTLTADGCHPDATLFTLFLLLFPCPSPRALDQGPEESGCDYSSVPLPRSPVGALGGAARSPS